jgi:hypothetical protein
VAAECTQQETQKYSHERRREVKTPECATKPLTLDEAIAHADEVAGDCCTACRREHKQLADWLRELKSRRSAECGSVAKLREAVKKLLDALYDMGIDENTLAIAVESPNCHMKSEHALSVLKEVRDALAEPVRNCDVGTATEQTHRFDRHCDKYLLNRYEDEECVGCPLVNMAGHCELNWAQMPY